MRDASTALRALAAERDALCQERDALKAENARLLKICDDYSTKIYLAQAKHARHLPALETRIARQRRALAKLYRKRHDRKAERDHLEKTAMKAAQRHEAAGPSDSPKGSMLKPQEWRRLKPIEPSPETKTLRDEFAMAALSGMLGHSDYVELSPAQMSAEAYRQADAMLEARGKGEGDE